MIVVIVVPENRTFLVPITVPEVVPVIVIVASPEVPSAKTPI